MAPKLSRGFQGFLDVLSPDQSFVVAPVAEPYPLKSGALVINIKDILKKLMAEVV